MFASFFSRPNFMKVIKPKAAPKPRKFFSAPVLLAVILAALFWKSFLPDYVLFSNDGPLGQQNTSWSQLPAAFTGTWWDLNDIGGNAGSYPLDLSALIRWVLSPVAFAKFFQPLGLFILGLGAWTFLRALKLTPLAALLGAMAAMLNSAFFRRCLLGGCIMKSPWVWGFSRSRWSLPTPWKCPWSGRWTRLALAGLRRGQCHGSGRCRCSGELVRRCLCSFQITVDEEGLRIGKIARSIGRVAVVAVFAGFIAMQTVVSLVGNCIQSAFRHGTGRGNQSTTLGLGHAMEPAKKRNARLVCAGLVWLSEGHANGHDGVSSGQLQRRQLLGRRGARSRIGSLFRQRKTRFSSAVGLHAVYRRRELCRHFGGIAGVLGDGAIFAAGKLRFP